jgi:hypothetical protein
MSPFEPHRPGTARTRGRPALTWRRGVRAGLGVLLTLLGLLWVLQGGAIVRIEPIMCAANCEPIQGGSPGWFAVGVLTLLGGLRLLGVLRRRHR